MAEQAAQRHTTFYDDDYDYSFVTASARIAFYDDMKSAPRITVIDPAPTNAFIENLTTTVYNQAKLAGGSISYTVIREVSENFIHARFKDIVVSILDGGDTIRFADQGPGIEEKEKAQQPGFTSATEPMTDYIRGVGSGLPIVRDYFDERHGTITIEDNLRCGSVVTISLQRRVDSRPQSEQQKTDHATAFIPLQPLSDRERQVLLLIAQHGTMGVTELSQETNIAASSIHSILSKLEQAGLVEKGTGKKRVLTEIGHEAAARLS